MSRFGCKPVRPTWQWTKTDGLLLRKKILKTYSLMQSRPISSFQMLSKSSCPFCSKYRWNRNPVCNVSKIQYFDKKVNFYRKWKILIHDFDLKSDHFQPKMKHLHLKCINFICKYNIRFRIRIKIIHNAWFWDPKFSICIKKYSIFNWKYPFSKWKFQNFSKSYQYNRFDFLLWQCNWFDP